MASALKISGRVGRQEFMNETFEPMPSLHNMHTCWAARTPAPRYIYHSGKSRWCISKRLDDGSRCWAYVQDPGGAKDPSTCPGPWQCMERSGQWGSDHQLRCDAVPCNDDPFVQLRMSLDSDLRRFGLLDYHSLKSLWKRLDYNGNNIVSLAEIDKFVVELTRSGAWPEYLGSKPALMRAFKKTTLLDGDGDEWVEKKEFRSLLLNIFWFGKLFFIFDQIDTDDDRRIDFDEFYRGLSKLGLDLDEWGARDEFDEIDTNGGGHILFVELCAYIRKRVNPDSDARFDADIVSGEQCGKHIVRKFGHAVSCELQVIPKSNADFDELEKKIQRYMLDHKKLKTMWNALDFNGNDIVSLAEIDKWVIEHYPILNHKPALRLAHKLTLAEGNGDDWVQKKEFKALLASLFYFNKIFWIFDEIDGDDRRISFSEFERGLVLLGCTVDPAAAREQFDQIDQNQGGYILFEEFCQWFVMDQCPESIRSAIT